MSNSIEFLFKMLGTYIDCIDDDFGYDDWALMRNPFFLLWLSMCVRIPPLVRWTCTIAERIKRNDLNMICEIQPESVDSKQSP